MSIFETLSYQTVINIVRRWPPDRRFALVHDVFETLLPEMSPPRRKRKTLNEALGLLATEQPAPSDAEIQQWLDERRMEKYARSA